MEIAQRTPRAVMIIEQRLRGGPRVAQVRVLRRRIDQPAIRIAGVLPGEPEHVMRPVHPARQEHHAERRPRLLPPAFPPPAQHPILVRLVTQQLRADALFAERIERLRRVVDLKQHVEHPAPVPQLKMAVRLLPVLPDLQR